MNISRGAFIHVENELYGYSETKKAINNLRNEIIYNKSRADDNVGGGRSNLPGDPTGTTATMLVSHKALEHMEQVVYVIDQVYSELSVDKQNLIRMKYWTRPQRLTWDGIAMELHISRRQAINWRDGIILCIAERIGWR